MLSQKMFTFVTTLVLAFAWQTQAAAPKNQSQPIEKFTLTPFAPIEYKAAHQETSTKLKSVRKPSNVSLTDTMISAEARKLRDRYFAVKTSEDLAVLVNEADAGYDAIKERDAKIYAALLASLKPYQGLLYRLRPIVESEKVIHSMVLTRIMNFASTIKFAFNSQTNEIVFEYFAAPYKTNNDQLMSQIKNEGHFVEWLAQDIKNNHIKLINRLYGINFTTDSSDSIVIDKALAFGSGTFKDGVNRYERMGEVEKQLMILGLELQIVSINMLRAYNQNGSLKLAREMGSLYGIDGFFLNKVDGVTMLDIKNVIARPQHSDLYTILPDGKKYMAEAYMFISSAAARLDYIWGAVQSREADDSFFINAGLVNAELPRAEQAVKKVISLVKGANADGSTQLKSNVTGEVATFNIKNFFTNPPEDLKFLLPTGFDKAKTRTTQKSQIKYRNYYYGSPSAWDVNRYKTLLPQANDSKDITSAIRVWNHSAIGMVRLPIPGTN